MPFMFDCRKDAARLHRQKFADRKMILRLETLRRVECDRCFPSTQVLSYISVRQVAEELDSFK